MDASSNPSPTPHGQKRSRPNSYAPQACDRCRSKKQRCYLVEEDYESCQNCIDNGSTCVFSSRAERPKKGRQASSGDMSTEQASHTAIEPSNTSGPLRTLVMSAPVVTVRSTPTNNAPQALTLHPAGDGWSPVGNALSDMQQTSYGLIAQPVPYMGAWQSSPNQHYQLPGPPLSRLTPSLPVHNSSNNTMRPTPPVTFKNVEPNQMSRHSGHSPPTVARHASDSAASEPVDGLAMISLEASAEPHYVGESSGSLWTTVLTKGMQVSPTFLDNGTIVKGQTRDRSPSPLADALLRANLQRPITNEVADRLLGTVYRHIQARYPFMDWVAFDSHWKVRDGIFLAVAQNRPLNKEAATAAFFILMIFAIGSQLSKKSHLPNLMRSDEYYALALCYLNIVVQLHNLANVQGLLLLAMYSLRDSRGPSIWYISGVCVRLCIGLGLHRNPGARALRVLSKYNVEMRKRVFWSAYTIDRMTSMILGRPPGISDDDIDVDMPDTALPPLEITVPSMRSGIVLSAVHYIKLQRIESKIQRTIYTVANRSQAIDLNASWSLLNDIDQWEREIPAQASTPASRDLPCCTTDWFNLRGVEARLHVLRPMCTRGTNEASCVSLLAQNAVRGCEAQKRLHQSGEPTSSTLVHSTFICGLALLYSVFVDPQILPVKDVFSAIKAVSNTLFAYSRNEGASAALYHVFEELSGACMEKVTGKTSDPSPKTSGDLSEGWKKVSAEATGSLDATAAGEYFDFLRNLEMPVADADNDPLWNIDFAAQFLPSDDVASFDISYG